MISFREFIEAYQDGSIKNNITWRAYDIQGSVRRLDAITALKWLGYQYAREHGLAVVRANYALPSTAYAKHMLEYWWGLRRASAGNCVRVKVRSAKSGLQGRSLAASDDPP